MLPEYFAVIGAIIGSIGGFKYLYDTIKGTARPNRVTWLLWGLLPMVIFVAQRTQGVEGVSWVSFAAGLTPLLIFAASFLNKNAYWQTTSLDYLCMAIAFVGIGLWAIAREANTAILFSIIADAAAAVPTVIKAYKYPGNRKLVGVRHQHDRLLDQPGCDPGLELRELWFRPVCRSPERLAGCPLVQRANTSSR